MGNEFSLNSISKIIIDEEEINIKSSIKEYKFSKNGNHTIKFSLSDSLNMDYMFKDSINLVSLQMFT